MSPVGQTSEKVFTTEVPHQKGGLRRRPLLDSLGVKVHNNVAGTVRETVPLR